LINREITMPQDWHAVEGMQRKMAWLTHLRLQIMERVWHLLMREDEPHNVDERAARKPIHNEHDPRSKSVDQVSFKRHQPGFHQHKDCEGDLNPRASIVVFLVDRIDE